MLVNKYRNSLISINGDACRPVNCRFTKKWIFKVLYIIGHGNILVMGTSLAGRFESHPWCSYKRLSGCLKLTAVGMHKRWTCLQDLLPMCYRCSTTNPLLNNQGNICINCRQPFVYSFVSFGESHLYQLWPAICQFVCVIWHVPIVSALASCLSTRLCHLVSPNCINYLLLFTYSCNLVCPNCISFCHLFVNLFISFCCFVRTVVAVQLLYVLHTWFSKFF